MAELDSSLVSDFAKAVASNPSTSKNTIKTLYATVTAVGDQPTVVIDGSESSTPVESTVSMAVGDRVLVEIQDHTATVTGNQTANAITIGNVDANVANIAAASQNESYNECIRANIVNATNLIANSATIESIAANKITAEYIVAEVVNAQEAEIEALSAKVITAGTATIEDIVSSTISTDYLKADMANLNTVEINTEKVKDLFVQVGLVAENAVIKDGHITGYLDAVEVNASNITAGTLTADRILLKDAETGNYIGFTTDGTTVQKATFDADDLIKEHTITADHIVASSITATEIASNAITADKISSGAVTAAKISVTDLQAIGATIGGWKISNTSIYKVSGVTSGTASTQRQTYLGCSTASDTDVAFRVMHRSYDGGTTYGSYVSDFYIRNDGYIYAAGGGKIGAWNIGTNANTNLGALYNNMTSLDSTTSTGVYIGPDGISLGGGKFKVTSAGDIILKNGVSLDLKLDSYGLSFTGSGKDDEAGLKFYQGGIGIYGFAGHGGPYDLLRIVGWPGPNGDTPYAAISTATNFIEAQGKWIFNDPDSSIATAGYARTATNSDNTYNAVTDPTSATVYQIPFVTKSETSGYRQNKVNDSLRYTALQGTASTKGVARLILGNNISSGAARNKQGYLRIYGSGIYYTDVLSMEVLSIAESNTVYLPKSNGYIPVFESGSITSGTLKGGDNTTTFEQTFNRPFKVAPKVMITPIANTGYHERTISVTGLSVGTTGFTVTVMMNGYTSTQNLSSYRRIDWLAVGV